MTVVHLSIAVIWALLVAASAIVFLLSRRNDGLDRSELEARTRSWWVMIAIFTIALLAGETVSILLFAFISFLALKEFFSMIPTRRVDRRVLFWVYLAIPVQYVFVAMHWYGMFIIFIPVYMFLLIPARMMFDGETRGFIHAASSVQWGLMIAVFAISHASYLYVLPFEKTGQSGAGLLLFLVFLTQAGDVAQYTWGKLLGRRKVIPRISPNKTWEGLLGGVATVTLIGAVLGPFLTPYDIWRGALAGAIIGVGGFFGDIIISAIKRDLGIKDTGNTIPGHGGILDRVDSLTVTAPLFFHLTRYLHF